MSEPESPPARSKVQIPELQEDIAAALGSRDDASSQEAIQLSSGRTAEELRKEAEEKEHDRTEAFKDHFETISVCALYGASLALALVVAALFYHLLMPESWFWLNAKQLDDLRSIFTGSVLAGVVAGHFKKRL